jgi:hypothetical protein
MDIYRNFSIECTILPDAAGQYEAAFTVMRRPEDNPSAPQAVDRYEFPPVGSYLTPEDAREQSQAWAHKWIDANF